MKKKAEKKLPGPAAAPPEPPAIPPEPEIQPTEVPPDEEPDPEQPPATEEEADDEPESPDDPTIPEQPKKRGPGRPSSAELAAKPNILERIANYESFAGIWIYLYRIGPKMNKLLGGTRDVNLKRYDCAVDAEDIKKEFGSGYYHLRITKQNEKGQRPEIDREDVRIIDLNFPPAVPPGEWVDDPANKEWEWARKIIFKESEKVEQAPQAAIIDMLNKQADRQHQANLELQKQLNTKPEKDPQEKGLIQEMFAVLREALKPPPPQPLPPPAPPDPFREMMATFFMEKLKAAEVPVVAKDPLDEIDRIITAKGKLENLGGKGHRGGMEGWQEFTIECVKGLVPIVQPFAQVGAAIMMDAQRRSAAQQPQPAAQAQPQPQPQEPEILKEITPEPQPAAAPGPQLVKKEPTFQDFANELLATVGRAGTGYQLGDWFIEHFGEQQFKSIRVQGKERMVAELAKAPNFQQQATGYQQSGALDEVIDDFFLWEPPDADAEEEEKTPPTPDIAAGWANPAVEVQS